MKFVAAVVLLPLLAGCVQPAEAQYFNKRIDPFGQGYGATAFGVEVSNSGHYVIASAAAFADSVFYSSVVTSLVLNEAGEVVSTDRVVAPLTATYPGWSNSMAKRLDGGLVVGGSNLRSDSSDNLIRRPVLFFISAMGLVDSLKALGPDNQEWLGRSANQALDGGYVICGDMVAPGATQSDAFVIRTDAQGNELWTHTYGGPWNDYLLSIAVSSDTVVFAGGLRRISNTNQQFWVQRLGASGDVTWEKVWGGAYAESTAAISLAANGDVLVGGAFDYVTTLSRRYLARLSATDGSFVWQYQYGPETYDCALQTVKEIMPSLDLIACGSGAGPNAQVYGTLLRTTSEGDSLWMRFYQYEAPGAPSSSGLLRDVTPTPDGGFIAVGSAFAVNGVYSQDVWAFKVDSMGCLEPGCHLLTGIESQVTNLKGALTVAPNPVRSGEAVQVSISLPPSITPQGPLRLTVVSSEGRVVQEQLLAEGGHGQRQGTQQEATFTALPAGLSAGLYHLHLSDGARWLAGAKLVVE